MPGQLELFGDQRRAARSSIWSQLPIEAQQRLTELFAEILLSSLRPNAPRTKETDHEPLEGPGESSGP
jgi:hypothetical protein